MADDKTISEFRANHGRVGGPFEGAPLTSGWMPPPSPPPRPIAPG